MIYCMDKAALCLTFVGLPDTEPLITSTTNWPIVGIAFDIIVWRILWNQN
jgi:hypothetical protein